MIVTNPNHAQSGELETRPHGFGKSLKTEKYSVELKDETGQGTGQFVRYSRSRVVDNVEMPIDQTLSASMFDIDVMMREGLPLEPVTGFSLSSETPESLVGQMKSVYGLFVHQQQQQQQQHQQQPSEPQPKPQSEPQSEPQPGPQSKTE